MIEDLGGLSKVMPVTFFSAVVFSLAIAGIPPLNGFASKWLIYQGIVEFGKGEGVANQLWIVWLVLAMFGSALTLASFVKFLSGIFLGHLKDVYQTITDNKILLCAPQVLLAILCIVFGVFAAEWVIPKIIVSVSGEFTYTGVWESATVSLMVALSIILGLLIYVLFMGRRFVSTNLICWESRRITGSVFRWQSFTRPSQKLPFCGLCIRQLRKSISIYTKWPEVQYWE
jgi:formate hydrogenlyase subunit 3/multisubunit Na+/H+ antiporter MnhD subunit